eukprot:8197133-Alexandrium_andersonii.AAC.1
MKAKFEAPRPRDGVVFVGRSVADQLRGNDSSVAQAPIAPPSIEWEHDQVSPEEVAALNSQRKAKREKEE